ncbi:hypothetical protein ACHAXT_013248 [Thalassiosira profunda]
MPSPARTAAAAALLLALGVVSAAAGAADEPHAHAGIAAPTAHGASAPVVNTRRKKRALKTLARNKRHNKKAAGPMHEEDVEFWTRLLQGGSLPGGPTPRPTRRPPQPPSGSTPEPSPFAGDFPTYSPSEGGGGATPAPIGSCGLTSAERRSQIVDILSVVSDPDLFEQPGSPQQKALDWLVDEDSSRLCPDDDNLVQRYTLAAFYYSTGGDAWKECSAPAVWDGKGIAEANEACTLTTVNATTIFPNDVRGTNAWLTPGSECRWGGVSCYPANTANALKVNVVEFENNGLDGTLPVEMEQLDKMRFFALERGALKGPIPSSYGNLRSLLLLDFDFNALTGDLPEALWDLTSLRQLDLNDNRFEGELSGDIGKLRQLRFFQIDNNRMTGAIPAQLGDIPNFSLIGLSGNDFVGAMPSAVCDLRPSPLQTLVVDCSIECDVPSCCTSCVP